MLARIRKSMEEKDRGFTLIELLVVMIIIGILAAIAIPVFLNQRKKAVDTSIRSDLRTVAQEAETYFVDNQTYDGFTVAGASVSLSGTNTIETTVTNASGFCLRGYASNANANSATKAFWYDSIVGGLQAGEPGAAPTGGACAG